MPLARLLAALLAISLQAAFFGRPHRLLPPRPRLLSFAFLALLAAFFAAALLRHNVVAGVPLQAHAGVLGFYTAVLLLAARARPAEVSLYLAASTGVDLSFALAGTLGVDIARRDLGSAGFAWELAAAATAIVRMHLERRRAAAAARGGTDADRG